MHGFLSQKKKVLSLIHSLSLSLSQFFDEFFIHSSIYAKLLIFGNHFSFFLFFFFFSTLESLCSFSHLILSDSFSEFKKRLSLFLSQFFDEFFNTFFYLCQITNLWELFLFSFFFSTLESLCSFSHLI